jgi:hypothetical protein
MMFKKIMSFLVSFYLINILSYFIVWRNVSIRNFDRILKDSELLNKMSEKGVDIEKMKQTFLDTDKEIFNPFYNIGFYLTNWKIIPSIIISFVFVYFIFRKK